MYIQVMLLYTTHIQEVNDIINNYTNSCSTDLMQLYARSLSRRESLECEDHSPHSRGSSNSRASASPLVRVVTRLTHKLVRLLITLRALNV